MEKVLSFLRKKRKLWISLGIALLIAFVAELIFNIPVLSNNTGIVALTSEEWKQEGLEQSDQGVIVDEDGGSITVQFSEQYVDKFYYKYTNQLATALVDVNIDVTTTDAYGNETVKTIADNNPYQLRESIVDVGNKTSKITIRFGEGLNTLVVTDIGIKSLPVFNQMRWIFVLALAFIVVYILLNRKALVGKVERVFLVMGLTMGTMIVCILPLSKVGLDEEVHFNNTYKYKINTVVSTTDAIDKLTCVSLDNWPYNLNQSYEEYQMMKEYYGEEADYRDGSGKSYLTPTHFATFATPAYTLMALTVKIGKFLRLPFYLIYILGRWTNLLMYVTVIYFAIKKLPIGKYIMAVLALMPTPLFQSCVYSYDAVVTSFVFLGLAYLLDEILHPNQVLTIKNGAVILAALSFGCLPKAVFVPLLFLGFMIKKSKFKNKNQRLVYRGANIVCIIGLLFTFVLPTLFAPDSLADTRGGNVNVGEQLRLVLTHPFGFVKVWLTNVGNTFWSYTFGNEALGGMGHLAGSTCVMLITLLIIYVIATDNSGDNTLALSIRQKAYLGVITIICVGFVWGAMYLAYNEVGVTFIGGVQGRYFIPLLFILYMILHTNQIENKIKPITYMYLIYGVTLFILGKSVYDSILVQFCM